MPDKCCEPEEVCSFAGCAGSSAKRPIQTRISGATRLDQALCEAIFLWSGSGLPRLPHWAATRGLVWDAQPEFKAGLLQLQRGRQTLSRRPVAGSSAKRPSGRCIGCAGQLRHASCTSQLFAQPTLPRGLQRLLGEVLLRKAACPGRRPLQSLGGDCAAPRKAQHQRQSCLRVHLPTTP